MIHIKRLVAKFNVYKLKIKKLENTIKTLWGVIDELEKIIKIAGEFRKIAEDERLKKEAYAQKKLTAIFGLK